MKRAVSSVVLAAVAVVGCVVSVSDFAGKSCETAADCPEPYVCVAARPGAGRTCEALRLPQVADGGGGGGPVPTYCKDIQPILMAHCISTCHGADNSGSKQTSFRLDYYEPTVAGQVRGAKAMAPRIKLRAVDFQDMPPLGSPEPTAAERELLGRWAEGGAPLCDSGPPADGGTDGGP